MQLGIVTYNIAANWDLPTIISTCEELGLGGVELRTTHAHGVEIDLTPAERAEIKARFADSPVELVGLGSAFEYHAPDPAELKRNLDGTKEYIRLAADVGTSGVKVRPNALPQGVPVDQTLAQIGMALREIGAFGADLGIEVRLEVHGRETSHVPHIATVMQVANHPNVRICWNSNEADRDESGEIGGNFALVADRIALVHINVLHSGYPYRTLFRLLRETGYTGFTLAEIPGCPDLESAKMLLNYYKALWEELSRPS